MPDFLSIEDLIIDDSFHNYCFQKNETDIFYWQKFICDYPSQEEKIEEAKQLVLGLHVMLKEKHSFEKIATENNKKSKYHFKILSVKKVFRYAAAVAAVFTIILVSKKLINNSYNTSNNPTTQIAANKIERNLYYKTAKGERKIITLPDNTKIWLNAASELRVDKAFGKENRIVFLSGEALFDVIHNESLPFTVHTDRYEVRDLGTVFNVKAYPNDKQSETSLIRGKVEIQLVNSTRKIFLLPNQKAVVNNNDKSTVKENKTPMPLKEKNITILPLSFDRKDSAVVETAWAQNRLEIVNENFYEMRERLERWFNVKISIKDDEVGKYTFTATFEKENIQEILKALQSAYHFNYKIESNEINISK